MPKHTLNPDVDRLRSALVMLVRDIKQDHLNVRQLAILSLLVSTHGPHTIRKLASTLGIAKPAVTRATDRLEYEDLAKRLPDPADGRSVLVVPTQQGIRMMAAIALVIVTKPVDLTGEASTPAQTATATLATDGLTP